MQYSLECGGVRSGGVTAAERNRVVARWDTRTFGRGIFTAGFASISGARNALPTHNPL